VRGDHNLAGRIPRFYFREKERLGEGEEDVDLYADIRVTDLPSLARCDARGEVYLVRGGREEAK